MFGSQGIGNNYEEIFKYNRKIIKQFKNRCYGYHLLNSKKTRMKYRSSKHLWVIRLCYWYNTTILNYEPGCIWELERK